MRRVGFLFFMGWWNMQPALWAENPSASQPAAQATSLPKASILDSTQGNVRRIQVRFDGRQLVSEGLTDHSSRLPLQNDFGQNESEASLTIDGARPPAPTFKKRLLEAVWLVDGSGDGFYLPSQPDFELAGNPPPAAFRLQEISPANGQSRKWLRLEFGKTSPEEMEKISSLMTNPVLAPLQITENDDAEIIVYDLATQITAYVITHSSERMNSAGYLSGSSQPCVVLLRAEETRLTITAGRVDAGTVRLKLFGDWQPAAGEAALIHCDQKAGRTWIEFAATAGGSDTIDLVKMPEESFFKRLFEAIGKK